MDVQLYNGSLIRMKRGDVYLNDKNCKLAFDQKV